MRYAGLTAALCAAAIAQIWVSPSGSDTNPGTEAEPLATLEQAREAVRSAKGAGALHVYLRGGTYYLPRTLVFGPQDSGTAGRPVYYEAYRGETVVISGGTKLRCAWQPYRDGIHSCRLPDGLSFDQLFVNGTRRIRARYPNYNAANPLMAGPGYLQAAGGTGRLPDRELMFDPATFTKKRWANPTTGIVHAFQSHYWGNLQYRITGVDYDGRRILLGDGGFQINRAEHGISQRSRFYVENIFEELDAPGEWFLDEAKRSLYYKPEAGVDLSRATVVGARLANLVEFRGSAGSPVRHITLRGLTFTHTRTTFLDPYEKLGRGDWSIHRGGAVFFEGAEDCGVEDSYFDSTGGSGLFVSKYARRVRIAGNRFERVGESAVALVGSPEAVRSYRTWDSAPAVISTEPGPQSPDYPADCVVEDNLIRDIGIYGKQTAGVFLSMSARIRVAHNTIYEVPRAAICINDGTWGGHVIEFNDIWETVRETGEHGPFNSWGRDRFWEKDPGKFRKELVLKDAMETTVIRHNRIANFRRSVSAGNWTIDVDDGSSNYHIYGNLGIGSTLKLRDGYYREARNNIFISSVPLGLHVWPAESEDTLASNIIVVSGTTPGQNSATDSMHRPIRMPEHPWGRLFDRNLYFNQNTQSFKVDATGPARVYGWEEWRELGYDRNSLFAPPLFMDPENGDYRVRPESPALALGFRNFPMDRFGSRKHRVVPRLASVPKAAAAGASEQRQTYSWLGASLMDITDGSLMDALGSALEGVLVDNAPTGSGAHRLGLRSGDVILKLGGRSLKGPKDFLEAVGTLPPAGANATVHRNQGQVTVRVQSGS